MILFPCYLLRLECVFTLIILFLKQNLIIAVVVMAQTILTKLGQTLFLIQSVVAFSVFLLAGQREAFPRAGLVTSM